MSTNNDYVLKTSDILAIMGFGYNVTPYMIFDKIVNGRDLDEKMDYLTIRRRAYGRKLEDDMKVTLHEIPLLATMYPNLKDGLVRGREYFNQELGTDVKPNYQNDELGLVIEVATMGENVFDYYVKDGECPKWLEVKAKILMYFQSIKRFKSAIVVVAVGNKPPEHAWVFHFDEKEQAQYRNRVNEFRDAVAKGVAPEFTQTDAEFYKSDRKNVMAELSEDEQKQFEDLETQYVATKKEYDVVYKEYSAFKKKMDELKSQMLVITKNLTFCGKLLSLVFTNPKLSFNTEAFLAHIGKKFNMNYDDLVVMKEQSNTEAFNILIRNIAAKANVNEDVIRAEIDNENCLRGVTPSASCKINK
jgi:hypothetical protein